MVACRIDESSAEGRPIDLTVEPIGVEDSAAGSREIRKEHTECDREQEQRLELFSDGKIEQNERS